MGLGRLIKEEMPKLHLQRSCVASSFLHLVPFKRLGRFKASFGLRLREKHLPEFGLETRLAYLCWVYG